MADRKYHLWRQYHAKPFSRYACTVIQADTEDGFRVIDFDPNVADPHFLDRLGNTLRSSQWAADGDIEGNMAGERATFVHPGDPSHFGVAIRMVPEAYLSGAGRP